ncbi:mitochondrial protein C2orf69 homolog isoform X2 [Haematobia irritans]|uniref:mitochondrial protein C2orf69 homolog isoform X2 n=1 Tax=Haematobia irritans TaxID=7368 RepID=UPI003F50A61F
MSVTIDNFFQLQKRVTNSGVMLGGSADRLCTPSTSAGPFRIFSVSGFQNRSNDIVYCPPINRQQNLNDDDSTAVVYFGGDVQDFPESMETNRDSRGYMKYNLENSAILLREAFPRSHIIVVRPVRMEFKTFSCFDNFVRGNNAGVPDHTPMNHALQHLEKLLQNLSQRLISIPENEILDQAAQAQAAAASLVSSSLSNASSDSSSSSSNASDSSQEMDIDILQVQENVTVESDGAAIFSNSTVTNSGPDSCELDIKEGNSSQITNITDPSSSTALKNLSLQNVPQSEKTNDMTNDNKQQHYNNPSDSNNCSSTQQQNSTQIHATHQHNNPLWWRENLNLDKSKLILIGFSKGCVVLNQFIYEFHYLKTLTPDDSTMVRLLSRISDMYWLDGGHGGQKNTWITSRSLLETLTRMAINIHVHLTPYQVQDDRRPWIRKEEKIFTDLLRRLGAQITRHLHYDSQTANLMTHFEVLQAFCQHIHSQNLHVSGQNSQMHVAAHVNVQNNEQQQSVQSQPQANEEK